MDYNLRMYILVFHRILDFKNKGPISIGPFYLLSEFKGLFFHNLVYIFLLYSYSPIFLPIRNYLL